MNVYLYNTASRAVEVFEPLKSSNVGMYCCGPTVYNYAHIGNLRTYIFEDLLKRVLLNSGFDIKHVMNVTDVGHLTDDGDDGEDKMLKASRERKLDVYELAKYYTNAFFRDTKALNIIEPNIVCNATDHIADMIDLIKVLEAKGHTYIAGGNVYFSIDTFPRYGELARLKADQLKAGARVDVDTNKKNPRDFVLWFTQSKFENQTMIWPSPWGDGYPGWHIECSAMSMKYLGPSFDIHCGGIDHIPVHHTNEIAQSEAATGKKWVKYWVHGEFLLNETGKMSKSKGEFLTLPLLEEKGYDALDYRFFCLGGHYRSQLVFSWSSMDGAKNGRRSLMRHIKSLRSEDENLNVELSKKGHQYLDEFNKHVRNDLNTPRALAVVWTFLQDKELSNDEKLTLIGEVDKIFALDLLKDQSENLEIDQEVLDLVEQRRVAKQQKNYPLADKLRDIVENKGYQLKDTPSGTEVSKKV